MRPEKTLFIGLVVAILLLTPAAVADTYVGGIPLATVADGVVSGGLYYDAFYGLGGTNVQRSFTIPEHTNVEWARLYVAVYCGNMRANHQVALNVRFDGNGDGTYERSWNEHLNTEYSWPGEGGTGPVELGNGNRVTSDYLYWYDVTGLIQGTRVNTEVTTARPAGYTGTFDGRIRLIALVVAYDDGTTDQVFYRVNQGHDTSSYHDEVYVGETGFDLPSMQDDPVAASLAVIHLSSVDGRYWINGEEFEGRRPQGSYSGFNRWDVLDRVVGEFSCTLEYQKQPDATFFKVPLAMLTVTYPEEEPKTGEIFVESVPSGAWISLDGVNTTKKTPATLGTVLVGDHTVSVSLAGYQGASMDVTVREDEITDLLFELQRDIPPPSGDGGDGTAGTGYHGSPLTLYERGGINGTLSMTTAGLYTGLLEVGKGDENTHIVALPENATVRDGRLYIYTTWGHHEQSRVGMTPGLRVTMDGYSLPLVATYGDRKGYGAFDYLVNTFVFDMDERIVASGNYTFQISNDGRPGEVFALYGSALLILAEVPDAPAIQYWITEGCDAVLADPAFGTRPEDATTTAYFDGLVDIPMVQRATLTAVSTAASGLANDQNRVSMNEMEWFNILDGGSSEISSVQLSVRDHLFESENTATIQSYAEAGEVGDYLENRNLILVLEMRGEADEAYDPSAIVIPEIRQPLETVAYAEAGGWLSGTRLSLGNLSLIVAEGSRAMTGDGDRVFQLSLQSVPEVPLADGRQPERAFRIEPHDGLIDIPMILTFPGDEKTGIFRFDSLTMRWEAVSSIHDAGSGTVSARISRLGMYGIDERERETVRAPALPDRHTRFSLPGYREIPSLFFPGAVNGDLPTPETSMDIPDPSDGELLMPEIIRIDHTDKTYPLRIISDPPGALISIDGVYHGKVTPYTIPDLPAGEYQLDLSLDGFTPVSERIDLTMEMVVSGDLSPTTTHNRVLKINDPELYTGTLGGIYVTSRPAEAEIFLDGRRTGRTTPQVLYGITPGMHTIRLRHPDITFPVENKDIRVYPREITPVSFARHDEIYTRTIQLDNPAYAGRSFSVNGVKQTGTIPSDPEVRGVTPLVTIHDQDAYLTFRVIGDRIDWNEPETGSISVTSSPSGAAITLDGFQTGLHTPAVIDTVSAGRHHLLVSKPGYLPVEREFWMTPSIHGGISATFDLTLEPYVFGSIRMESEPEGARIYLYGQNTGLLTPQLMPYMPIGGYSVRLTGRGGAQTVETTVHPYREVGVMGRFT